MLRAMCCPCCGREEQSTGCVRGHFTCACGDYRVVPNDEYWKKGLLGDVYCRHCIRCPEHCTCAHAQGLDVAALKGIVAGMRGMGLFDATPPRVGEEG